MKNRKRLPRKSIVRVIIALAMVMAILVCSSYATIQITRHRLESYATTMAEQQSAYVNSVTNMMFIGGEWIVNSFMAGISDIESSESTTSYQLKDTKYVLSDKTLAQMTTEDIYSKLESFVNYHDDFSAVVMIFEPGVLKNIPEGIAAKVMPGDNVRYNLSDSHNVFGNKFYHAVRDSDGIISKAGFVNQDSLFVSTDGLPMYDERGNFIGEFWIETDADTYSDILEQYKSENDEVVALINNQCRIIASTNKEKNGAYLKTVSVDVCDGHFPADWYSQVKACMSHNEYSHFSYNLDGYPVVTYIFPIASSPYRLLIIKPENRLYSQVRQFIWLPIAILIVSILLISLCLAYLFFVIKRENDETARMEGELNIAAEIQRGILPPNPDSQTSPGHLPYDIYGFQHSAKSVGGDLYDFKQTGDLLHFCIGDVSGKGMPAALVMTELCSLYRYIISQCDDPREIVSQINKAVMERSDESMFCTLFVGVLNLKSGILSYCNAGHNPPIYINSENQTAGYMTIKPNMPINAFADYKYDSETMQFAPGDRIYLYTDGVTEAKNESNHFFGEKATLETIARLKNLTFSKMVDGILADLKRFTKKARQNDDITMLCVEYRGYDLHLESGKTSRFQRWLSVLTDFKRFTKRAGQDDDITMPYVEHLRFESVKGRVVEIVDSVLGSCGMTDDMRLRLAVEESVQNIADYAYPEDGPLEVQIAKNGDFTEITLIDNGEPFNPLEQKEPDLTTPLLDRQIGGLGIFLTVKTMDEVSYEYVNGQNRLTLKYKHEST